jgi:hypothetical protein
MDQRVKEFTWEVVVQNLRKVFAKKIKLLNPFWQFLYSPFEATLMINDSSEKIYDHKKAWGRWKSLLKSQYFCFIYTLIHPILSYNCEIWYMDEYLPLYRAMLRATRNNTFCDTLAIQEKSSYEKIHTKYCKTVLGLKKNLHVTFRHYQSWGDSLLLPLLNLKLWCIL